MYPEERQAIIAERLRQLGRVEVTDLATDLEVTPETVRRDLNSLERAGVVRRVHGGAIPADGMGYEPALAVREAARTAEKARIAAAALEWLPREGAIALDGGSTIHCFAEILPLDCALTVVTNNLAVAMPLADRTDLTVHIVGGRLRGRTLTTVDEVALAYLRSVRLDAVFLGTNGLSLGRGLTTPDSAEAAVKRAFIASARQKVLLTDSTKFGLEHFAPVADLAEIDAIITDTELGDEAAALLEEAGPRVVRV